MTILDSLGWGRILHPWQKKQEAIFGRTGRPRALPARHNQRQNQIIIWATRRLRSGLLGRNTTTELQTLFKTRRTPPPGPRFSGAEEQAAILGHSTGQRGRFSWEPRLSEVLDLEHDTEGYSVASEPGSQCRTDRRPGTTRRPQDNFIIMGGEEFACPACEVFYTLSGLSSGWM
uniref:Uncharacterized protein n=1 Tax=Sphaerodactylus townsendi TaxID=933632 RepID=A0ACB8FRP6_9SAUR